MTKPSPVTIAAVRLFDWRVLLSLFFCLTLALAPSLAEARGGGGKSSFGSRGARTFESNSAAPITRSTNPAVTPGPQAARPAGRRNARQRRPAAAFFSVTRF